MSLNDPLKMFDVAGKVALITGASGAFGAVAAQCLSGAGCKVVLAAGNAEALAEAAANCVGETAQINARPDSEDGCTALVAETVNAVGRLDILVVASGMNKVAKIDEMAPETFEDVMDANVTQSWMMARAATRQMLAQGDGGKIVLMSSARGLLGHPAGYTAYCSSKAGISHLMRVFALELGPLGIRVNTVAPGATETPMIRRMMEGMGFGEAMLKGDLDNFRAGVPMGRIAQVEDVADAVTFLLSDQSKYITMHEMVVDGGAALGA